jgi:hypothetical protein
MNLHLEKLKVKESVKYSVQIRNVIRLLKPIAKITVPFAIFIMTLKIDVQIALFKNALFVMNKSKLFNCSIINLIEIYLFVLHA